MADELRRGGISGLGLHTWQSVIGVSVARAEQNPVQVCLSTRNSLPVKIEYSQKTWIYRRVLEGSLA